MKYLMLSIAIVSEVLATTAMKQSDGFIRPLWTVLTVVGYVLGRRLFETRLAK